MTTGLRDTQDEDRAAGVEPRWTKWAPRMALPWLVAYGLLRLDWAAFGAPAHLSPVGGDLVAFTGWASVALCTAGVALAWALRATRLTGRAATALTMASYAASIALVASGALFLLDVIGGLFPGLGVRFYPLGALSRAACITGGVTLGLSAQAHRRRTRGGCATCGRSGEHRRPAGTPTWAYVAAYLSVAGCVVRIAAQACVGFKGDAAGSQAMAVLFEVGFVLGGTVLPLALVHAWGRTWPRWVPVLRGRPVPRRLVLYPAVGVSSGLVFYFGLMLLKMIATRIGGHNAFPGTDLPEAFFWASVPAYWIWGVGMATAAQSFRTRTRPTCPNCAR